MKKQAESGTAFEDLARQAGSTVRSVTDIGRGSQNEALGRAAVEALFGVPELGIAVALDASGETAKVIKSSPVLAQPFDSSSKEATEIAEAIGAGLGDDLTAQYSAALQSSLEVELNESLWQRVSSGQI